MTYTADQLSTAMDLSSRIYDWACTKYGKENGDKLAKHRGLTGSAYFTRSEDQIKNIIDKIALFNRIKPL